ncbi:MAG: hypothetical protein AAFU49_09615 [Pseudomonadota bacterium]
MGVTMAWESKDLGSVPDHRMDWLTLLGLAGWTRNLTARIPADREDEFRSLLETIQDYLVDPVEPREEGRDDDGYWDVEYAVSAGETEIASDVPDPIRRFEAEFTAAFGGAPHCLSAGRGFGMEPGRKSRAFPSGDEIEIRSVRGPMDLSAGEVCMVVIDDGIGVANQRFVGPSGTRVARFLDMNHRGRTQKPPGGKLIPGTGIAWTGRTIDLLRRRYGGDEDRIYRAMGLDEDDRARVSSLGYRLSHGTHVMDLAAGYASDDKMGVERPIIAIQLPRSTVLDTSGSGMVWALSRALRWLRSEISTIRRFPKRLALNLSFGIYAGPHDGNGLVVQRLEAFRDWFNASAAGRHCEVFLPAGNSFQNRGVALFDAKTAADRVDWMIQFDDRTASFAEVWLPRGASPSKLRLGLTLPGGPTCFSQLGKRCDYVVDGEVIARIYHGYSYAREVITMALRPSETLGTAPRAPSGRWQITVKNPLSVGFALRVQRDDPQPGSRRKGRQSYLVDETYWRVDHSSGRPINDVTGNRPVTRQRTLNVFATGASMKVAAGYVGSARQAGSLDTDRLAARYSSAGPTDGTRKGPDYAYETESGRAHFGTLAAGSRSGSALLLSGTSSAAPQAARAWADGIAVVSSPRLDPQRFGLGLGDAADLGRPKRRE